MVKKIETVNTTIRLDADLRALLEAIAGREQRSLSGQITQFLRLAAKTFLDDNDLKYYPDIEEVGTEEEYAEYLANLRDACDDPADIL